MVMGFIQVDVDAVGGTERGVLDRCCKAAEEKAKDSGSSSQPLQKKCPAVVSGV